MVKSSKQSQRQPHAGMLDEIYNDPSTKAATTLFKAFAKRSFTREDYTSFIDSLENLPAAEKDKIQHIFDGATYKIEADLTNRDAQLAWAAALAHITLTQTDTSVRRHPVWQTLTHNPRLTNSLTAAARYIDMSMSNPDVSMDWGTPGSWFYFTPDKNHINIDLFHTLICGFDDQGQDGFDGFAHSIAVMMHEIGHAELTVRFPKRMQDLKDRDDALIKRGKKQKLTDLQRKELMRTKLEFALRMSVFNAAEDNCVNRYAANIAKEFPHNFSKSLNIVNMILQGSAMFLDGEHHLNPEKSKVQELMEKAFNNQDDRRLRDAQMALDRLNRVLALSFYTSNGLFSAKDYKTWERLGIDPKTIRRSGTTDEDAQQSPYKDFDDLMRMNVGYSGIAYMQPAAQEKWSLKSTFQSRVTHYADERCAMIEKIWNEYAAEHAQILIDAVERLADQPKGNEQGDPGNGDPAPGQGNKISDGSQSEDLESKQNENNESGNGDQPNEQNGQKSQQQNAGDKPKQKQENQNSAGKNEIDKDKLEEMMKEELPSSPEEMRKAMQDAKDALENMDDDTRQKIEDLVKQVQQGDGGQDANSQSSSGDSGSPGDGKSQPPQGQPQDGGTAKGEDLSKLARNGDWSNFKKRANELGSIIDKIAEDFEYVKNQQIQTVRNISKKREELPRGGDLQKRLDMRAHMDYAIKRQTGQKIEDEDRKRWRKDDATNESASVELWILVDGSGSMAYNLPKGGRRIDSAVQSVAVLYETSRRAGLETFVGMWGDDNIRMMAAPGDSDQKVGQNFQKMKDGINSGTQLSPAFKQAVEFSAKQETDSFGRRKSFAGMTHFLIISDGELNTGDIQPMVEHILTLFQYGPDVTIDIAVMGSLSQTGQSGHLGFPGSGHPTSRQMQQVVDQVKRRNPAAKLDIIYADDPRTIPVELAQKIKGRFEQGAQNYTAKSDGHKREALSRAHTAMKKKLK